MYSTQIGAMDLVLGAALILAIFVAFTLWVSLPLLPYLLMVTAYSAIRYGVPALARSAVHFERATYLRARSLAKAVASSTATSWSAAGRSGAAKSRS